jgi:hypothetical protein
MKDSQQCLGQADLLERTALSSDDPLEKRIYETMATSWRKLALLADPKREVDPCFLSGEGDRTLMRWRQQVASPGTRV